MKFKKPSFTKLLLLTFLNTRFSCLFNDIDIQVVQNEIQCLQYITKSDRFFFCINMKQKILFIHIFIYFVITILILLKTIH